MQEQYICIYICIGWTGGWTEEWTGRQKKEKMAETEEGRDG
jgi:hypothetical protein